MDGCRGRKIKWQEPSFQKPLSNHRDAQRFPTNIFMQPGVTGPAHAVAPYQMFLNIASLPDMLTAPTQTVRMPLPALTVDTRLIVLRMQTTENSCANARKPTLSPKCRPGCSNLTRLSQQRRQGEPYLMNKTAALLRIIAKLVVWFIVTTSAIISVICVAGVATRKDK